MPDNSNITDRIKVVENVQKPPSKIIGERDLHHTYQANRSSDQQAAVRDLATLSLSSEGRNEIQQTINRKANEDFQKRWTSLLREKGRAVPADLPDRHTPIDTVKESYGMEAALAFAVARGTMTEEKSRQTRYMPDTADKFKKYDTKAELQKCQGIGTFEVVSEKAQSFCRANVEFKEGKIEIDIDNSNRDANSDNLHLSAQLGQICKYAMNKLKHGMDDYNNNIAIKDFTEDKFKITRLGRNNVTNEETINTIILALKDQLIQLYKDNPDNGSINIKKDSEAFLAIMGTLNGYTSLFLPREYPSFFEKGQVTRIEVQFTWFDPDISKDEIEHSDMHVDTINFHYDEDVS